MSTEQGKFPIAKFPLRLMSSVRRGAEVYSEREGVSLNQFINVAVAEKLAQLQQEEWLSKRRKPTKARVAKALAILNRAGTEDPQPGDELPPGYVRTQQKKSAIK